MEQKDTLDVIGDALRRFLKPIVVEVITESLSEAFIALEKSRQKRYYTRAEACQRLHIGTSTFYRLANTGKITILKLEGRTLVDADELDTAIEKRVLYRYKHD